MWSVPITMAMIKLFSVRSKMTVNKKIKIPLCFDFSIWLDRATPKLLPSLFLWHNTAFDLILPQQPFFLVLFQGLVFNYSRLQCRFFPELCPGFSFSFQSSLKVFLYSQDFITLHRMISLAFLNQWGNWYHIWQYKRCCKLSTHQQENR